MKESEINYLSQDIFREEILRDYRVAYESGEASLIGRREVLTGKAKFGIFGDDKELPQLENDSNGIVLFSAPST